MLYLKKYLTEGLIQVALLLSLCGLKVDVGLEPYLLPSWQDTILGPTSTLSPTQFHNLRNLHPKDPDLDHFFTSRRLLGWVRSLDRLQVPSAELETWLVQRERDTLPGGTPDQPSLLERASAGQDRERERPTPETGDSLGTLEQTEEDSDDVIKEDDESTESLWSIGHYNQSMLPIGPSNQFLASEPHHQNSQNTALGEEEEEELARIQWGGRQEEQRRDGRRRFYSDVDNREVPQDEAERTSPSLQECLRLLDETFPLRQETQSSDDVGVNHREVVKEHLSPARGPLLPHLIPLGDPCLDLEQQWEDLLACMEDMDSPAPTALSDHTVPEVTQHSRTIQDSGSTVLHHCHSNSGPVVHHDVSHQEAVLPQGLLLPQAHRPFSAGVGVRGHPLELNPALAPLMPSAQLEDFSLSSHRSVDNYSMNPTQNPSYSMDLTAMQRHRDDITMDLATRRTDDITMDLHTQDDSDHFNMNFLTEDLSFNSGTYSTEDTPGNVDVGPYSQSPATETFDTLDMNLYPSDPVSPSSSSSSLQPNGRSPDFSMTPSNHFLVSEEEEEWGDEGVPSLLGELLEDAVILDETSLLDLALEEGFSSEMVAMLEEEGYFGSEVAEMETGNFGTKMSDVEEEDEGHPGTETVERKQRYLGTPEQGQEDRVDTDSGLSLDFSHSPASPCASEASSYSSTSSSSASSSSSSASMVGSPFTEEEEEVVVVDFDMEVQVKIEEEEEEEGAVGGSYSTDMRKMSYQESQQFTPWHIRHDHTYNQPWSSSPAPGKTSSSYIKSSPQHGHSAPYQPMSSLRRGRSSRYHLSSGEDISEAEMRSRDERRARSLKIPFNNDLIVNLPVEEFNELLTDHRLNEEQLTLIRDIRRRGKNKMAAQNCRRRKLDILLELEDDSSGLRRRRTQLLREKQEMIRSLKEMTRSLSVLYQDVFSSLRDEEGRPLSPTDYMLQVGPDGTVAVSSRQQGAALTKPGGKAASKKRRHMKK